MSQFLFLKFRTTFYDHRAGLDGPAFNWPRFKIRAAPGAAQDVPQIRGCSSVGRAPDLHSGGRRFDPDQLHQMGL